MIESAIFLGSKSFGLKIFKTLYQTSSDLRWTILCPPDLNDTRTHFDEFNSFAQEYNLDLLVANSPDMIFQFAKDNKPDVMFVCGYYRILSDEILSSFQDGVWGIHNSLLPKYRGGSPLVWQLINGEPELGSSLFKFDKGIDDGPVLEQVKVSNTGGLDIKQASQLIEDKWVESLPRIWRDFCDGNLSEKEQNHKNATYCAQRREEDGEIDWSKPNGYIKNFVMAQGSPYPGAFFLYNGTKVKVIELELDSRIIYGTCGQVFQVDNDFVTICTGGSTGVKLKYLEVNGKMLKASEVLNSFKIRL